MYKLTNQRRSDALSILAKYQRQMEASGRIDCRRFEKELRECWRIGFQELTDIVVALSKEDEYERIAAYYIQYSGVPGPVSEFQPRLAELYGVCYYESEETGAKCG